MATKTLSSYSNSSGFTLIEVIIVVAVIAILSTIAVPSYTEYVRRNHRTTAQTLLTDIASRQQQFLLNRRRYATMAELGVVVPDAVSPHYTITVATALPALGAPTFVATATPLGGQAADSCGTLTLDQTGARAPTTARCW